MGSFAGLNALVTGGASGIGLATARALAAQAARVTVLDLAAQGPADLAYVRADVSDDAAVQEAVAAAVAYLGGLDVLVNNAGIGAQRGVEDNSDDEWRRVLDVNVLGTVQVTRAALPALRQSRHAAIVNLCSIAATAGLPQRALYSASKGALLSLTMAMAADLLPHGIRVNAVNPGTADTPWVGRLLLPARRPAVQLPGIHRHRLRSGHGGDRHRSRHPALVGPHRPLPRALGQRGRPRMVGTRPRDLPSRLTESHPTTALIRSDYWKGIASCVST
jgi:NAD(P)-dependent dehydrogenase (short-subunit alcohol dehydrogenase family)